MSFDEWEQFVETNPHYEYIFDDTVGKLLVRNGALEWYRNDIERATAIDFDKLPDMSVAELVREVNKGLEVEGITRVTGYMTKVSGWNPGKRAELKDRHKDAGV